MCLRTFDPLTTEDVQEIVRCSLEELKRFTADAGNPPGKYSPYLNRLIAVCLCQGAAQHYVDLQDAECFDNEVLVSADEINEKGFQVFPSRRVLSGIKDVDVVLFFEHFAAVPIPNRKHCLKSVHVDLPRAGRRRVDFMKKTVRPEIIGKAVAREPSAIIKAYVRHTPHGRYLGMKSVVGLHPVDIMGLVIWRTRRLA